MLTAKLKVKNQLTIPKEIVECLHLKQNDLFSVDTQDSYIRLIPVDLEPRYTPEELRAIDRLVEKERVGAKKMRPGKQFLDYANKITLVPKALLTMLPFLHAEKILDEALLQRRPDAAGGRRGI